MLVMDNDGNLFDDRRKSKKDRRKKNVKVEVERRKSDRRVENINEKNKK